MEERNGWNDPLIVTWFTVVADHCRAYDCRAWNTKALWLVRRPRSHSANGRLSRAGLEAWLALECAGYPWRTGWWAFTDLWFSDSSWRGRHLCRNVDGYYSRSLEKWFLE